MSATSSFTGRSFKVSNFKCFGNEPEGFAEIKPINIIIGRNNSGKSALLDLVGILTAGGYSPDKSLWHGATKPIFSFSSEVTETLIKQVFPFTTRGGNLSMFANWWEFGKHLINTKVNWTCKGDSPFEQPIITNDPKQVANSLQNDARHEVITNLCKAVGNPFLNKLFRRLLAERDIQPESSSNARMVSNNGSGATNIIQQYLTQAILSHNLIEKTFLGELNTIFNPDSHFTRIRCDKIENERWEIFLDEEHKGTIALSQSGSGLKTVILVLINLIVIPYDMQRELTEFIFAFEELENNLHPSLLRRLLLFIAKKVNNDGILVFLTTHSSTVIDLFSKNSDAQILHVRHDKKSALVAAARTYIENKGVLDDLDIRASDLLQANGIIWVEGPSDRIYINRWINLWSNSQLKEGIHYQCVFYGGRLLSHLEAGSPDETTSGIPILRVARHAIIIIDSDKKNSTDTINETKLRIEAEILSMGGISWITEGKEIENYLPKEAFLQWKSWDSLGAFKKYGSVFDVIDKKEKGSGKKYFKRKTLLAEQVSPFITKENSLGILDLATRMTQIIRRIREWNQLPE